MERNRVTQWVAAALFGAVAVGLSLSDRVPHLFKVAKGFIVPAGRAAERMLSIDLVDRSDIPWAADEVGHVLLWGLGMVVLGLAFRRRIAADAMAAAVFIGSVGMEFFQQAFTSGRSFQLKDMVANGIGILAGLTLVVMIDAVLDHRETALVDSV